jgi:hypothetical protein
VPGTLEADRQEVSALGDDVPQPYIFRLSRMPPTKTRAVGEVRVVDSRNFPASKGFAAALVSDQAGRHARNALAHQRLGMTVLPSGPFAHDGRPTTGKEIHYAIWP